MAVTAKDKRVVWALAGARCAICKKPLVEQVEEVGAYTLLGDVAHIHARRDGGPRANSSLPAGSRNHPDNLVLLCLEHHKIVDDHPDLYPVEKLVAIKKEHELWVRKKLDSGVEWVSDIYNFFYINVPRILMLAEFHGVDIQDRNLVSITSLKDLGGGFIALMQSIRPIIEATHPKVLKVADLSRTDDDIGRLVQFEQRFRTKNLGKVLDKGFPGFKGDLKFDPHMYGDVGGYKLVMPFDPRWLTTATAAFHLSSGQGVFSGLCIVNSIDHSAKTILCSPLVIGHPKRW